MKTLLAIFILFGTLHVSAETPVVTIHLLDDHTDKQKTKTRFWIDLSETSRGIISTKTISGEDADNIIQQLRTSLKNTEATHLCRHDPIYGIEATDSDGKTLHASLCFVCLTWIKKPGLRLDISGEKGPNNELCKMLRKYIELPQELLKEEKPESSDAKG